MPNFIIDKFKKNSTKANNGQGSIYSGPLSPTSYIQQMKGMANISALTSTSFGSIIPAPPPIQVTVYYMTDELGDIITDESGNQIQLDTSN